MREGGEGREEEKGERQEMVGRSARGGLRTQKPKCARLTPIGGFLPKPLSIAWLHDAHRASKETPRISIKQNKNTLPVSSRLIK